jgi:hypothetical protein
MPSTTLDETRPAQEFGRNDRLIVDLGMNDGTDTFFYLKKGFNVVAVEANPVLARQSESLLGRFVRADRLRIVNKGITDSNSDDHLDFYINHKRSEWSSFLGAAIAARWTKGQNSSILISGLSDFTWRRPRRAPLHTHRLKASS